MGALFGPGRAFSVAVACLLLSGAAIAGDAAPTVPPLIAAPANGGSAEILPDPSAWQDVITGQIQAFHDGDATKALSYAGAAFQKTFTDPAVFMMSIAQSGYTPIMTSVSHSFGSYSQPDTNSAVQVVKLVGAKQDLFEAIYAMTKEAGGWRVQGVELMQMPGMGV